MRGTTAFVFLPTYPPLPCRVELPVELRLPSILDGSQPISRPTLETAVVIASVAATPRTSAPLPLLVP